MPLPVAPQAAERERDTIEEAAAGLVNAGVRLLESLSARFGARATEKRPDADPLKRLIAPLIQTDPRTSRSVLAIPLPDSAGQERLIAALSGLLAGLAGSRHE